VVVANADPAELGRVKVSVPQVYGVADSGVEPIGVNDLPWAIPAGLPAGGSQSSGGIDWLPDPGDQVLVFLLDGDPEKPVWMWLMQTLGQSDPVHGFPLHQYQKTPPTGKPTRAGLTRYGHTVELNSGSVVVSTKSGYQFTLINGEPLAFDGLALMRTPRGQLLEIDDLTQTATLNVNLDTFFNIGQSWIVQCGDLDFESLLGGFKFVTAEEWTATIGTTAAFDIGGDFNITTGGILGMDVAGDWTVKAGGLASLDVAGVLSTTFSELRLGAAAEEPFVLGNRLMETLNMLLVWAAGHVHSNGNNGSPTGPPITPPQPEIMPLLNTILSTTITGQ